MHCIILAAGYGRRMNGMSGPGPKALLTVGGRTLLEHQLDGLADAGVTSFCVVVGHRAEDIRAVLSDRTDCELVLNETYRETNSLYSLWLARDHVEGPFMVVNGDVLAHPEIYHRTAGLVGSGFAYDSSSGQDPEHMKVALDGSRLTRVSKTLPADQVCGENVGILRIDASLAAPLFQQAGSVLDEDGPQVWAPEVLNRLARQHPILGVDIAGLPWTEIDFPEDLRNARELVWPRIQGRERNPGPELGQHPDVAARLKRSRSPGI